MGRINGAYSALDAIEKTIRSGSPSPEILEAKRNLKNGEIDDKALNTFKVGNSA